MAFKTRSARRGSSRGSRRGRSSGRRAGGRAGSRRGGRGAARSNTVRIEVVNTTAQPIARASESAFARVSRARTAAF